MVSIVCGEYFGGVRNYVSVLVGDRFNRNADCVSSFYLMSVLIL